MMSLYFSTAFTNTTLAILFWKGFPEPAAQSTWKLQWEEGRMIMGQAERRCKRQIWSRAWWRTPLIPALGRQRQADFWVLGQPGLQSELQDCQGYTEKPCLEKQKTKNKKQTKESDTSDSIRRMLALFLYGRNLLEILNIPQCLGNHHSTCPFLSVWHTNVLW